MSMIEIEINGQTLETTQGAMIIEVADANNISIPRFCYHKKLSVAANCRMCLVEVEKMPKPVPACATPVTPGMKIYTASPKALDSQRAVMEFLLINHPLDCPICDQGGECELQDNSVGFGLDHSPFEETKRSVEEKNIGPLVSTALTRCIQCTRCVRFGQEVAGVRELGMIQRGEHSEIALFVEKSLTSEVSANIIDLCPVGALTSKPFLYSARAWELDQTPSIASHDALGSHIHLHTRRNTLMRVVPKENEALNEVWLSDRDRFSYLGVNSAQRLLSPMLKRNGTWIACDWETALKFSVESIQTALNTHGPETLLGISSPNATTEEYYLLEKLIEALGAKEVTSHIRATDVSDADLFAEPHFGLTPAQLENQKNLLIIGSQLNQEMPLLGLRLRKAALNGALINVINPSDYEFNFTLNTKRITAPCNWVNELLAIVKASLDLTADATAYKNILPLLKNINVDDTQKALAQNLMQNKPSFIYLGALAYHADQAGLLRALVSIISDITGCSFGMHSDGANSMGIAKIQQGFANKAPSLNEIANLVIHKAILLHNIEPTLDCANPAQVSQLLANADIVIALTPFKSEALMQHAQVLLPIASLGETSGTFVNLIGEWQSFTGCIKPKGESRPAWKVLRVLGNLFNSNEFTYTSSQDVLAEIQQGLASAVAAVKPTSDLSINYVKAKLNKTAANAIKNTMRLTQWPIYRTDNLVRHADALQVCGSAIKPGAYVNQTTLTKLGVNIGQTVTILQNGEAHLIMQLDNRLADDIIFIPAGFEETARLGASFGEIVVKAVD